MHTIVKSEDDLWTIGSWTPDGNWAPIDDYSSFAEAAAWCSYLNGGLNPLLTQQLIDAFKPGGAFTEWPR